MTSMNFKQTEQVELTGRSEMPDGLTKYLREISQFPLLTPEEECVLSAQILAGQQAEQALSGDIPEEERTLYRAAAETGRKAQEQLVAANLRLVVVIAKTYQNRGLSLLDLIQEGNLGLMKAAARYDASTGNRFSTCASWWIRQGISRAITDQGRAIRLPANVYQKVSHLRRAKRELSAQLGREPSLEELAEELSLPVKKVQELCRCDREVASLDTPLGDEDSNTTLGDVAVSVTPMETVDEAITHVALCGVLERALNSLDEQEHLVLEMRYGLGGYSVHTLEAVSQRLGLTRERVRQIENRALRLLRTGVESRQLAAFIA